MESECDEKRRPREREIPRLRELVNLAAVTDHPGRATRNGTGFNLRVRSEFFFVYSDLPWTTHHFAGKEQVINQPTN